MTADMQWVLNYWRQKAAGARQPSTKQFRLVDIPAQILALSLVVDVHFNPTEFTYRFWGSERTEWFGNDLTGRRIADDLDPSLQLNIFDQFLSVSAKGEPAVDRNVLPMKSGMWAEFDTLRLPLRGDGEKIDRIYGLTHHRRDLALTQQEAEAGRLINII